MRIVNSSLLIILDSLLILDDRVVGSVIPSSFKDMPLHAAVSAKSEKSTIEVTEELAQRAAKLLIHKYAFLPNCKKGCLVGA